MPQATFRFPRVHSQEQVRVTSDSGGTTVVARLRADLRGQLQNLVGPDGVTTLYLQSETGTTTVTGTVPGDGAATTQAAVDTAVAALVTGAPAALDTLDELAAALGDDANFAATITTALAARLTTVSHGSTAGTARPTSTLPVLWIGTVAPANRATRDLWMDETAVALKRWDGATWAASGGSSVAPSNPLADVFFTVGNPGNNLDIVGRVAPPQPNSAPIPGHTRVSGLGRLHGMGVAQGVGAGGAFTFKRLPTEAAGGPSVYIDSTEVLVMSLDGTQVAYAYPDQQVIAASTDDQIVVPFTSGWVVTGDDLSVADGTLVTAAGGTFLVLIEGYVSAVNP